MTVRLICGDALAELRKLPSASVNCCVTSPPYYGLRDYGTASWEGGDANCDHKGKPQRTSSKINHNYDGGDDIKTARNYEFFRETCGNCGAKRIDQQIGLEPSPDQYVEKLVAVFREVRRVLRDDGTLWLNIGDSYNGYMANQRGTGLETKRQSARKYIEPGAGLRCQDLKNKDLIGIPWMLAFALRADGWYLRQDVIWSKLNPMPESVTDRCTKSHEYLFLLSKSASYFYDAEAIKEKSITGDPRRPYTSEGAWQLDGRPPDQRHGGKPRTAGNKSHKYVTEYEGSATEEHRTKAGLMKIAEVPWDSRNKRSVWSIATEPYPEAHFATFPEALVIPCIKAGCPYEGVVLDPFSGSGTVGVAATRLGRDAVLIELSRGYVDMARKRIIKSEPLFAEVSVEGEAA